MKIISAQDYRCMPWKNGGGVTAEIAISPAGATLGDFDWRISSARVSTAGEFSCFPGIDRSLVVLEGGDLTLHLPDNQSRQLTPASAPYAFDGAMPISATLSSAAITDLNVMTRRDRCRHRLQRIAWSDSIRIAAAAAGTTRLVFHAAGEALHCHCRSTGQVIELPAGATLLLDAVDAIALRPASAAADACAMLAVLYLIEITTI